MYFANFRTLKIEKDYNYLTKNIPLELHNGMSIKEVQSVISAALKDVDLEKTELGVLYKFEIKDTNNEFSRPTDEAEMKGLADFLLTIANIAIPLTFAALKTGKGYPRERRLGVPDRLKPLHTSYSSVKSACNDEMITPKLNIIIALHDMFYCLCDGKTLDEVKGDSSNE